MLSRSTDPEERDRLKLLIKTIEVQLRDYDKKKKKGSSSRLRLRKERPVDPESQIFMFYTKQQMLVGSKPTFEQIQKELSFMNMGEFMVFCKDFGFKVSKTKCAEVFKKCATNSKELFLTNFRPAVARLAYEQNKQELENLGKRLKELDKITVKRIEELKETAVAKAELISGDNPRSRDRTPLGGRSGRTGVSPIKTTLELSSPQLKEGTSPALKHATGVSAAANSGIGVGIGIGTKGAGVGVGLGVGGLGAAGGSPPPEKATRESQRSKMSKPDLEERAKRVDQFALAEELARLKEEDEQLRSLKHEQERTQAEIQARNNADPNALLDEQLHRMGVFDGNSF